MTRRLSTNWPVLGSSRSAYCSLLVVATVAQREVEPPRERRRVRLEGMYLQLKKFDELHSGETETLGMYCTSQEKVLVVSLSSASRTFFSSRSRLSSRGVRGSERFARLRRSVRRFTHSSRLCSVQVRRMVGIRRLTLCDELHSHNSSTWFPISESCTRSARGPHIILICTNNT